MERQPLALTTGEPAGVGPELCALAAQQHWPAPLVLVGDPDLLERRAAGLGLALHLLPPGPRIPSGRA